MFTRTPARGLSPRKSRIALPAENLRCLTLVLQIRRVDQHGLHWRLLIHSCPLLLYIYPI
jgi:hypothetical protein